MVSSQWSKWAGEKIWEKTKCSDQLSFSGQFHQAHCTGPMVTRWTGSLIQLPLVEISWGKKSVLTNFHFLVNFSFQWLEWAGQKEYKKKPSVLFWAWGKHLKKNLMFWPTCIFWSISSDTLVAWLHRSPVKNPKPFATNKLFSTIIYVFVIIRD